MTTTTQHDGPTASAYVSRSWSYERVLRVSAPIISLVVIALTLYLDVQSGLTWSGQFFVGLLCLLLAGAAATMAPRRAGVALVLCILSTAPILAWLWPGGSPNTPLGHIAIIALALGLIAATNRVKSLTFLGGVGVALLVAGLMTAARTVIEQAYAHSTGQDGDWIAYSGTNEDGVDQFTSLSPVDALLRHWIPIFGSALSTFAAALFFGSLLRSVASFYRGKGDHSNGRTSLLQRVLQAPRGALALALAIASSLLLVLGGIQAAWDPVALWFHVCTTLVLGTALTLGVFKPRIAALMIAALCFFAVVVFPTASRGWEVRIIVPLVLLLMAAEVVILVFLPGGVQWWVWAVGLAIVGALMWSPPIAFGLLNNTTDFGAVLYAHRSTSFFDQLGGKAIALQAFLAILPVFVIPPVIAWAIRQASRVTVERRRLAVAREELKASEEQRALEDERRGIAGDVHDVLAHSLTVIVAQGEGALVSREPAKSEALQRMVEVARASLRDVRSLIERLDGEDTQLPSPGLDDVPGLIQNVQDAGVRLTVEEFGERVPLGDSSELALFRILQEALTNVLTHGGRDATARLSFDWRGDTPGLSLTLASQAGPGAVPHPGTGLGLAGMRTRAAVAGGWLSAGPDDALPDDGAPLTSVGDGTAAGSQHRPAVGAATAGGERAASGTNEPVRWLVTAHLPAAPEAAEVLR